MGKKWGKYPVWLGTRVSEETGASLQELAARTNQSMTTLVRNALENYLRQNGSAETSSNELAPIESVSPGEYFGNVSAGLVSDPVAHFLCTTSDGGVYYLSDGSVQ